MDIEKLRILCNNKRLIITQHCIKRMMERSIELTEIKQAIAEGEVIEDYPNDYPYPSCLILECVSKCREMQFRVDLPAFQGDFPQA